MYAYIFNIQRFSIHDGPGIRTTVFMQGCPLQCIWCHNPEGIPQYLVKVDNELPQGIMKYTPDELITEVMKDRVFFETSGGGVTFSGGEPVMQGEFLLEMLSRLSKLGIHSCVDTSGHAPEDLFIRVVRQAGLILFDLKIIDNKKHEQYTATGNSLILKNLETLMNSGTPFRVRIPLINEINANDETITAIARMLEGKGKIDVDLLSYHDLGQAKRQRACTEGPAMKLTAPDDERLEEISMIFRQYGHNVYIGG
jgi:pyruvate formate lyase activating enzyme